jgi:hypothetical protein
MDRDMLNFLRQGSPTRGRNMNVLFIAFGALAAIWILVLVGSQFFGPK